MSAETTAIDGGTVSESRGDESQEGAKQDEPPRADGALTAAATIKGRSAPIATLPPPAPPAELPDHAAVKSTRFPQSQRSLAFRKRFFAGASQSDWNNWHWQLRNSLRSAEAIGAVVDLTPDERQAMAEGAGGLPTAVTPYYASLISPGDPSAPIRRTMLPVTAELVAGKGEKGDPLGEDDQSPIPGLVHRYPDRALFMATEYCSAYCRYCTRSRLVGQSERRRYCRSHWERAIEYIRSVPAIRDVVISGGDPLTLPDEPLEWLLMNLRSIPHVEVMRIGTKTPAVLPMRITPGLAKILRRASPLWMSLHFTHPDELTQETAEACSRLADAGLPLGSQTVLLRGVNDDPAVMRRLMTGLMRLRVRPYYLYQCDPIIGSAHFRTPVAKGLEIVKSLRGHVSGYAVPHYVIDAPGGGGKIPLLPDSFEGRVEGDVILRNYQERLYRYPDVAE